MAPLERHILKWVKSGQLEDTLWVSLGFASKLEANDRLHIVCAKAFDAQDVKHRMDTIYLERFDQAYSCYHGARSIEVGATGVHLRLNAHGQKSLDFRAHLHLSLPSVLRGWKAAQKVFAQMSEHRCGAVIKVAHLQL
jgi:hypothetical protein